MKDRTQSHRDMYDARLINLSMLLPTEPTRQSTSDMSTFDMIDAWPVQKLEHGIRAFYI